jgi:hypothetical protein
MALLFFVAILVFCCWYLASDHEKLAQWYIGLNSCFYKNTSWKSDFFTDNVKATGSIYCIVAILISSVGLLFTLRRSKVKREYVNARLRFKTEDLPPISLCFIATSILWLWGTSLVVPSNDEAFSALNCASLHPFQTISYYMLPNNHILFNLLNNLAFHAWENKVAGGRILSLVLYWALTLSFFSFFKTLLRHKWLAVLVTITLALQFPVWGFATQARGYELLILSQWIAFISLLKYILYHEKRWLYIMCAACCVGYFTVPVFLYFHAALLAFAFFLQLIKKKVDLDFWKFQITCAAIVFLLYLPCLCFSGLKAITANPWVDIEAPYKQLWMDLVPTFREYMDFCFCNNKKGGYLVSFILFLLPVSLVFFKKNATAKLLGWFYICMWTVLIGFTLTMKVYPIDRALSGQFSVTLALVIYTLYLALSAIARKENVRYAPAIVLPIFMILLDVNYVNNGREEIVHYLCHFNVSYWDKFLTDGISSSIPRGSSVACSDESFYWYYLCRKYGYDVTKCPRGNEQYLVKLRSEPFIQNKEGDYQMISTVGDYSIYKRK